MASQGRSQAGTGAFPAEAGAPPGASSPPLHERRYALLVASFLAIVYSFNFMDRQIMSILQEPIRHEMGLSDTQLGLLTGASFAIFYTTFGIPVAWLADRTNRIGIMSIACAVWSLATAGCGLTRSFAQLAIARVIVGAGEAGGSPPSYSVISDYFPPHRRATGLAIYSLGVPIGSALGIALGGWIAVHHGWRVAFIAVGLPGLALALLMPLVIREPKRGRLDPHPAGLAGQEAVPSLLEVLAALIRNPTLRIVAISSGLSSFVGYAMLSWNPSFLERVKGMSLDQVAHTYSLVLGLTGIVGTFGAGRLVDRLGRRDPRWYGWVPAAAFALGLPAFLGLLWAPDWRWAMGFLTVLGLLSNMYLAPALAVVQNVAHPSQRTVAGAALLFVLNLIGLGGGPVFVGLISDLARSHGVAQPLLVAYWALIPVIVATIACHLLGAASMARGAGGALANR